MSPLAIFFMIIVALIVLPALIPVKCSKCKKRTTDPHPSGDKFVCTSCKQIEEVTHAQKTEQLRFCPDDGKRMEKTIIEGVVIDKCPVCQGVFIESQKFEKILKKIENETNHAANSAAASTGFA